MSDPDVQPDPPAEELDWQPVLAFLPLLADRDFDAGTDLGFVEQDDGSHALLGWQLSGTLTELLRTLCETGVVAGFDWPAWKSGRGAVFLEDPAEVAGASLEDCRRLLAVHARTDRFVEGHWAEAARSGQLTAVLARVSEVLAGDKA